MKSMIRVTVSLYHWRQKPNHLRYIYCSLNVSATKSRIPVLDKTHSANSRIARSNWLVTKLCKEGNMNEARKVFDEMSERDVVTWTALITGYIRCGLIWEARRLFDRVDAMKDVITWTVMVSGYLKLNRVIEAERLFEGMPLRNVITWNTMIDGYVRNGEFDKAVDLFDRMPERNTVSWNTLITGLAQCGRVVEARKLFDQMPERDIVSWTVIVSGLGRNGMVDEAREIFERMPEKNVVSWNAMITAYVNNMRVADAFGLFKSMPERNPSSWNTMISGFIQNGELNRARELFDDMDDKNVVTWTAMIGGCVQEGESEVALKYFIKMLREGKVKPNEMTFVSVLGASSDLAGLGQGQQIHQMTSKSAYYHGEFSTAALIKMYSRCGDLSAAKKIFYGGTLDHQRSYTSWNSMIASYAHHGCGKEAIDLFEEMCGSGFKPTDISYIGVLSACSHAGLVEEGLKYFDELVRDKSIAIREDHYTCLVDLCGRTGRLKEAHNVIKGLGKKSSSRIWVTLLAGCHIHGDMEIGKLVAEEVLKEDPGNAGTYSLLADIYSANGKWREATRLRLTMKENGLKKQPGCSWIEIGSRFHVFHVEDRSNCQSDLIFHLLLDLHAKAKYMEYAETSFLLDLCFH